MAATTSQGKTFSVFMVGITIAAAGLSFVASGIGKAALAAGLLIVAYSFAGFFKIKALEGVTAAFAQPALLKLAGVAVVLLGWLTVLLGLHVTANVSGRLITTLIGLAISLLGVLVILPAAVNKNATWKA